MVVCVCVWGGSQDHCGLEIRYERKPVSKSRKFLTPQASLKLFRCFSAQRPSQRAFDFLFSDSVLLDELGRAAENATTSPKPSLREAKVPREAADIWTWVKDYSSWIKSTKLLLLMLLLLPSR